LQGGGVVPGGREDPRLCRCASRRARGRKAPAGVMNGHLPLSTTNGHGYRFGLKRAGGEAGSRVHGYPNLILSARRRETWMCARSCGTSRRTATSITSTPRTISSGASCTRCALPMRAGRLVADWQVPRCARHCRIGDLNYRNNPALTNPAAATWTHDQKWDAVSALVEAKYAYRQCPCTM
jgi:hypothetical protein